MAVVAVVGAGAWMYNSHAQAEEAQTTASAQAAILGKGGKAGKGEKGDKGAKHGEKASSPLFKAAEEVTGLTADQKTKIEAAKNTFETKMKEVRKASKPEAGADKKAARKEMRAKVQPINDEARTAIEAVLTPEQKTEFATKLSAAQAAAKTKGGAPGAVKTE